MEMILYLAESEENEIHLFFRRSEETEERSLRTMKPISLFIPPGWEVFPRKQPPIIFAFL